MQLMDQLKRSGFGGAKMFTKDDLDGLSPEKMADMVSFFRYFHDLIT
jgi:hypothetical protein